MSYSLARFYTQRNTRKEITMKKFLSILLGLPLILSLTACGKQKNQSVELTVFAAASMQETLTEIGKNYQKEHQNVTLTFNFDSSGTLQSQIQEGAVCDLFISAGQKQMNALEQDGLLAENSRFDLLENKVALAVPEGNPAGIESYEDWKNALEAGTILFAMGNSDVPVGQYTQKILAYYGLDEAALAASGNITYASNVKEVTTQVSESTVDCGIIYATDAFSAGLTVVDTATPEMCGQVIYPAAVLSGSEHLTEAEAFAEYLRTPESAAVLEYVGFTPLG